MTAPGSRKVVNGRETGALRINSRQRIGDQFVAYRVTMLGSPAWRALSLVARRLLNRLEIEHCNHGGKENGRLVCTYDDFAAYGIRRRSIASGIAELVALGFIEVTERGRMA